MRRDRLTLGMMVGLPILQLILFGYAINTDPRHLPTALIVRDHSPFARSIISALEVSEYFKIKKIFATEEEADRMMKKGDVQFVLTIPEYFGRDIVRGNLPPLLLEADATDPLAVANTMAGFPSLVRAAVSKELKGVLFHEQKSDAVDIRLHKRYNPEAESRINIAPGLIGVILTMTMVIITAIAITRERERGTMEYLLIMPIRPTEVMIGKIVPYIIVGYMQATFLLISAKLLFNIPILGSVPLLFFLAFFFITANLGMGIMFSTFAKNQLQAVQLSIFYFLPNVLLSGFMFPFRGMPEWAQYIGSILPLTHFLPIVRGILLKGNGLMEVWEHTLALMLFTLIVMSVAIIKYRETLD